MTKRAYLGIDIGSLTVKVILIDEQGRVIGRALAVAGYGGQQAAKDLVAAVLSDAGLARSAVAGSVVTGYGRVTFGEADREVSEISCHARGASFLIPTTRTVIDVGGQDSKVIRIDQRGRVVDFAMNDKCAAGTGRFLEVMANALGLAVEELGRVALVSAHPLTISNTCTVFAESEAVSHLARGAAREDVASGLIQAVSSRVLGLAARVGLRPQVVFTGGVALNEGMLTELRRQSGLEILVPPDPQMVGARGAALFARQFSAGGS
ncbi:MAG: R-phenyllactate dehydratase activator [Chloroflexi bacterium ADurb.Bin180]|nr:MAG: R-phenyllactate dehydratase activator [Chloroflexi bacterium ADurb.Bin180]HQJ50606.1 acyl-CoA dehydratase activase [Anaerolineae bacterium]